MRTRSGVLALVVFAVSVISACAGSRPAPAADGSEAEDTSTVRGTAPSVGKLITAERIMQSGARTAWEALDYTVTSHHFGSDARGRPTGITADRGVGSLLLREEPLVFLDQTRLADIQVLHQFPAHEIYSIRVLSGADGTTYYGTSAVAGVILIRTHGAPRYWTDAPDPPEDPDAPDPARDDPDDPADEPASESESAAGP